MNIHNYNAVTGEYLSTTVATLDPIDKQPLVPAHATTIDLPILASNEVAVFEAVPEAVPEAVSKTYLWSIKSNNRGIVYDTTTQESTEYTKIGDLPANLTAVAPNSEFDEWVGLTWVFNIDLAKQSKLKEVKLDRNNALFQVIDSTALGTTYSYSVTERGNNFLNNLITLGNGSKFTCTNSSGTKARVFHTDAQLRTLGLDIETHISAQFDKYELKLVEIEAATSQVELDAITW